MVMVFRTKNTCVSHLSHDKLIVDMVVQKDRAICLSNLMRGLMVNIQFLAQPFQSHSN